MAKRHTIDRVDFNFLLWGINSNMEDYRLCWHFNRILGWQLRRIHDVCMESPKPKAENTPQKPPVRYNAYRYQHQIDHYTVEVLQNKNGRNRLLPELKNFDFLFIFQGEDDYFDADGFSGVLTRIPGIQSVIHINVNTLKSRGNLLLRHFNEHDEAKNETDSHSRAGV